MLTTLVSIFLIITLIIQIVLLLYMLINTIKRDREDKKFWDALHKDLEESTLRYMEFLNEDIDNAEEVNSVEDKK